MMGSLLCVCLGGGGGGGAVENCQFVNYQGVFIAHRNSCSGGKGLREHVTNM